MPNNNFKIIFIGDIVGRIGRNATKQIIPQLKKKHKSDLIIANGENLAHGKGITEKILKEMQDIGIDIFTSGNHIWKIKDIYKIFEHKDSPVIRPANYPLMVPGSGLFEAKVGAKSFFVLNLMGRVFMRDALDCPFRTADKLLKTIDMQNCCGILVDFHAEATSEKIAMKHYLDGRVSALVGTHTHVQTADEHITDQETAYISDVGAVIAKDSVIGVNKENIVKSFLWQVNQPHTIAETGLCEFDAVFVEIDPSSAKAVKIERIKEEIEV